MTRMGDFSSATESISVDAVAIANSLHRLPQTRVLVVGDVMLDRYWYGQVDRISPEAPVPILRVTKEEERMGAAANVAYNVVSLGACASLLSMVGNDDASHRLEAAVAKTGIQAHFGRNNALTTTVKLRLIGRQQQLLRVDFENTPPHEALLAQTALFSQLLPQHDVVLFSDYAKGGLMHVVDMLQSVRHHTTHDIPVLIDPKGNDYQRYTGATAITPNKTELQAVVGHWHSEAELNEKVQNLRERLQLQAVLLTRSEEGMTLFDAQGSLHVPTQAKEVFDVTGAGDSVIATLAAFLGAGLTLRQAVPFANAAGGVVVGKFGTATVSLHELMAEF